MQSCTAISEVNALEEIITRTEYFRTTVPASDFSKVVDFELNAVNPLNVQVNPLYVKTVTQKKTIRRKKEATELNIEKMESDKNLQQSAVQVQTSGYRETSRMKIPETFSGKIVKYRSSLIVVMFAILSVYFLYLYYLHRLR